MKDVKESKNSEIVKYRNLHDRLNKDIETITKYTNDEQSFFLDMFYYNSQESITDLITMYEEFGSSYEKVKTTYSDKVDLLDKAKNGTEKDKDKARTVIYEDAIKFKKMIDLDKLIESLKTSISLQTLHIKNIQSAQENNLVLRTKKRFDGYIEHLNKAVLTDQETLDRMEKLQKSESDIADIDAVLILTQITEYMKADISILDKSMEDIEKTIVGEYQVMKQIIAGTHEFRTTEKKLLGLKLISINFN